MSDTIENRDFSGLQFEGKGIPLGTEVRIVCIDPSTDKIYNGSAVIWGVPVSGEVELKVPTDNGKHRYFTTRSIESIN